MNAEIKKILARRLASGEITMLEYKEILLTIGEDSPATAPPSIHRSKSPDFENTHTPEEAPEDLSYTDEQPMEVEFVTRRRKILGDETVKACAEYVSVFSKNLEQYIACRDVVSITHSESETTNIVAKNSTRIINLEGKEKKSVKVESHGFGLSLMSVDDEDFSACVSLIMRHAGSNLLNRMLDEIRSGTPIAVGPLWFNQQTLGFSTGFWKREIQQIEYRNLEFALKEGIWHIQDSENPKRSTTMPYSVKNGCLVGHLLRILSNS